MMISSFQNATKALQHVAAAEVAHRAPRSGPGSGDVAPVPPAAAAHEDAPASDGARRQTEGPAAEAYAAGPRTVTVTVTMTVHDGGQVDLVL